MTSTNDPGGSAVSFTLSNGWNAEVQPLQYDHHHHGTSSINNEHQEGIILASIPLAALYARDVAAHRAFVPHQEVEADGMGSSNRKHNKNSSSSTVDNDNGTTTIKSEAARVALADYAARTLSDLLPITLNNDSSATIQTMGQAKHDSGKEEKRRRTMRRGGKKKKKKELPIPYVLERTDCIVTRTTKDGVTLQLFLHTTLPTSVMTDATNAFQSMLSGMLSPMMDQLTRRLTSSHCYAHVACVVLQRQLRAMLQPPRNNSADSADIDNNSNNNDDGDNNKYLNAVAFVADGSILPRKSGRSSLPMSSPPALPFMSPESEQLTRVAEVEVGSFWKRFLNDDGTIRVLNKDDDAMMMSDTATNATTQSSPTAVRMRGMIIPCGVTLIVGGGYHGKSTLLQHALSMGVYDAIPGDGRERCVSHRDAVSVRAEDGRYVRDVNVSAFLSALPTGRSINGASIPSGNTERLTRFRTGDASGSTSQAANVVEALESGASALLVDEDVSAANFMARDGRMRAMIMDEPITPLLYRVNGLFLAKEHQVSTVVVVGGVGEWLDVADAVVLMKDYAAYDGLAKARSVSYQFSYGHVQYGGKGVVHRLPWEVKEDKTRAVGDDGGVGKGSDKAGIEENSLPTTTLSPLRRRPESDCIANKFQDAAVHLLDGGSSRLQFYRDDDDYANDDDDGDEDDGMVDMSKCSQLEGHASEQLYGCGLCVLWLIRESTRCPMKDLPELLDCMDRALDHGGMVGLMASLRRDRDDEGNVLLAELVSSHAAQDLWETAGYAYRPRRHEVAMALVRMRGMKFDILPEKPKALEICPEEEAKRREEESRKKALAELWANRRKK